jgi:hypothetical protein
MDPRKIALSFLAALFVAFGAFTAASPSSVGADVFSIEMPPLASFMVWRRVRRGPSGDKASPLGIAAAVAIMLAGFGGLRFARR